MTTPYWKAALVTAALVAAVPVAQNIAGQIINVGAGSLVDGSVGELLGTSGATGLIVSLFRAALRCAFFGLGVFLSLRFIAPIAARDGWRHVVTNGGVATLVGAAAVLVFGLVQGFFAAVSPGLHPFGYAFRPGIDLGRLPSEALNAFQSALFAAIDWFAIVLLACVFLRPWLDKHSAASDSVSPAETP